MVALVRQRPLYPVVCGFAKPGSTRDSLL